MKNFPSAATFNLFSLDLFEVGKVGEDREYLRIGFFHAAPRFGFLLPAESGVWSP